MEPTLDGILLRDPSQSALESAMGDDAGPVLALLFVRSGVGGADRFPIRRVTSRLGRAPDNDVVLPKTLDLQEYPVVDVSLQVLNGDPKHSGNSVVRGTLGS